MSDNPFASYQITSPKEFSEKAKSFCQSGGAITGAEYQPFKRQVDFWFLAFVLAVKKGMPPELAADSVNMTPASILSTDPFRISYIQLAFYGEKLEIEMLAEHKVVFDWAQGMAHAGFPTLLQILGDDDLSPLMNVYDFIEDISSD